MNPRMLCLDERAKCQVPPERCSNCQFSTESDVGKEWFECHLSTPVNTFHKGTIFWCNKYRRAKEEKPYVIRMLLLAAFVSGSLGGAISAVTIMYHQAKVTIESITVESPTAGDEEDERTPDERHAAMERLKDMLHGKEI